MTAARVRRLPLVWTAAAIAVAAAALCSCGSMAGRGNVKAETEAFGSTTTHSRSFDRTPPDTCEAARRALLSQGFVIVTADPEHVRGRKNFQPELESHVEIEFSATCAPDGRGGKKAIAFVNALQDRYALKKSSTSASVGVGPIGSLSLPFSSSDDAMVRVASETVTSAPFYDRFFTLLQRYLAADADLVEPPKTAPLLPIEPKPAVSAPAASPPLPGASAASSAG